MHVHMYIDMCMYVDITYRHVHACKHVYRHVHACRQAYSADTYMYKEPTCTLFLALTLAPRAISFAITPFKF